MPEMRYESGHLRAGGANADDASRASRDAADALGAVGGDSPFGDVPGGDAFHGAVGHARDSHRRDARGSEHNARTAAQRARRTADLGDANEDETSRLAPRSGPASDVRDGM